MKVTVHQPDFAPWLGFFHRWGLSDLLILHDDIQYLRHGWQNRDRIRLPHGDQWLTVPVVQTGKGHQLIRDVVMDNQQPWRREHLALLRRAYQGTPGFAAVYPGLEVLYQQPHERLMDFNRALLDFIAGQLGIRTPVRLASEFHLASARNERLVDLMRAVGGTVYVTGLGARDYLDEALFRQHGLEVVWSGADEARAVYPARDLGLSALDFLFTRDAG